MKKVYIIILILIIGLFSLWYFDAFHKSVETINILIGKDYDYASKNIF